MKLYALKKTLFILNAQSDTCKQTFNCIQSVDIDIANFVLFMAFQNTWTKRFLLISSLMYADDVITLLQ